MTFVDGTKETFDMIIYATGYRTSFPMASHLIQVRFLLFINRDNY